MKRTLLVFAAFLTLLASPTVNAAAQPLTDQYIESIKAGCTDALRGILRVQRAEAVTRVNRGREYESLLKLVAAFNSRIVINNRDAPTLTSTAAKLPAKFSAFQQHYLEYADKVDETLKVNCKEAPVTFYDKLTSMREARAKVAADIRDMNALLDEYQTGLNELKGQLGSTGDGR